MTISSDAIAELTTVFNHANMKALTERYYFYDLRALIQQGLSDQNMVRSLYKTEVNFWQCLVKPFRTIGATTSVNSELLIELSYTRQIDQAALNYQLVADAFELFLDTMVTTIGYKWSGNLNVWQAGEASAINITTIGEKDCWYADFNLNITI